MQSCKNCKLGKKWDFKGDVVDQCFAEICKLMRMDPFAEQSMEREDYFSDQFSFLYWKCLDWKKTV